MTSVEMQIRLGMSLQSAVLVWASYGPPDFSSLRHTENVEARYLQQREAAV